MLHEFAVDPAVLNNWSDFRFLTSQFGIEHGRMISRFPKKWKALVYDASSLCGDIERKRIEEALTTIDAKLFLQQRIYDGNQPWLLNAETQHQNKPFRAIVSSSNPRSLYHVLVIDEISDRCVLWHVHKERCVSRQEKAMVECAIPILKQSREMLLVDPHFAPEMVRYRQTLEKFAEAVQQHCLGVARLEYHLEEKSTYAFFSQRCQTDLPQLIPRGLQFRFIRWREKAGGEKLHARYLLTDIAGLRYETGLDTGAPGETVDVSLLDPAIYSLRWGQYQNAQQNNLTGAFQYVDEVTIVGIA